MHLRPQLAARGQIREPHIRSSWGCGVMQRSPQYTPAILFSTLYAGRNELSTRCQVSLSKPSWGRFLDSISSSSFGRRVGAPDSSDRGTAIWCDKPGGLLGGICMFMCYGQCSARHESRVQVQVQHGRCSKQARWEGHESFDRGVALGGA